MFFFPGQITFFETSFMDLDAEVGRRRSKDDVSVDSFAKKG